MKHKSQHSRHHRTPFQKELLQCTIDIEISSVDHGERLASRALFGRVYPVSKIFVPQVIYLSGRCSGGEGFIFELPHLINALLM